MSSRLQRLLMAIACCAFVLSSAGIARAHRPDGPRPIVYSARYYLPPGSRGTSHFHLYRINPDGSGKEQITFGNTDDVNPVWSPDGRWIAFGRADQIDSEHYWLSVLNVSTGHVRRLALRDWVEFRPDFRWEAHPLRLVLPTEHGASQEIFTEPAWTEREETANLCDAISPGRRYRAFIDGDNHLVLQGEAGQRWQTLARRAGDWFDCAWISPATLAGLRQLDNPPPHMTYDQVLGLFTLGGTGSVAVVEHPLRINPTEVYAVGPVPGRSDDLLFEVVEFNSTSGGVLDFDKYSLQTGKLSPLAPFSEFVSFSPSGNWFATAPGRMPAPYSHWHNGQIRYVWAAPLYVVDTATGTKKRLAPATTWVYSADWRK